MLGVEHGDHVELFASSSLTQAQLESETERLFDPLDPYGFRQIPGRTMHTITAVTPEMVMVRAITWEEALRTLFGQWRPPDRQAIEARS